MDCIYSAGPGQQSTPSSCLQHRLMPHEAAVCRHATRQTQLAPRKLCAVTGVPLLQAQSRPADSPRDYLWVSDHALQQAYDRFAARSLSCRTQRRFGSNVPGPLEARRRLAKRRMAVYIPTTQWDENPVSSFLAGVKSWLRTAQLSLGQEAYPWKDLQWQPPWATQDASFPATDIGLDSSRQTSGTLPSVSNVSKSQAAAIASSLPSGIIPFSDRIKCCQTLQDVVNICSIAPLQPGADTHRAEVVLQCLEQRSMFWADRLNEGWSRNLQHLLTQCFRALEGGLTPARSAASLQSMLDHLQQLDQIQHVFPVWFFALQTIDAQEHFSRGLQYAALRVLRSHNILRALEPEGSGPIPPQHFARCFVKLDPIALGSVLLQCTANLRPQDSKLRARMLEEYMKYTTESVVDNFEGVVSAIGSCAGKIQDRDRWRLSSWIYIFVYKLHGKAALINLINQLHTPNTQGQIARSAITRLLRLLATTNPRAVLHIFRSSKCYVSDPTPIIMSLMDSKKIPNHDIMFVLWHGQRMGAVTERTSIGEKRRLSSARIQLVSDVALKFASMKRHRPSIAFRHVCHCYRYLCKHGSPVTTEVAEALYTTGVTQTLEARARLTTARFTWILGIIKDVYGPETAERLDEMTYQWRGQVRKHLDSERRRRWLGGEMLVKQVKTVRVPKGRYGIAMNDIKPRHGGHRRNVMHELKVRRRRGSRWVSRHPVA